MNDNARVGNYHGSSRLRAYDHSMVEDASFSFSLSSDDDARREQWGKPDALHKHAAAQHMTHVMHVFGDFFGFYDHLGSEI